MNPILKWILRITLVVAIGCCLCAEPFALFVAIDAAGAPVLGAIFALILAVVPVALAGLFYFALTQSEKRRGVFVSTGVLSVLVIAGGALLWANMEGLNLPTTPPAIAAGHDLRAPIGNFGPKSKEFTMILRNAFPISSSASSLISVLERQHFDLSETCWSRTAASCGGGQYNWREGRCQYYLDVSWHADANGRLLSVLGTATASGSSCGHKS